MNLSDVTKVFEDLTGYIQQGDTAPFENLFTDGHISVNVPRYGQIGNNIVFGRYLRQVRLWMRDRDDLRFEYWGTVPSADEKHLAINGVYYFMIHDAEFDYHKELHIPVSVMCEMEDGKIRTARVYYSTHWVAGHNITRPAMLNEDPTLIDSLPELEKLYFKCLWAGDSKPILDRILDHNAYFMGTAYSFNQGPDLVKTFNGLFKDGKNTELRLCTAFEAPHFLVVEYMNHRSGGNPNTPSAGMAIYQYNDDGKIIAVRLAGDSSFDHWLWPTL